MAVTQHYTHPGSQPHLGRQQRVTLGPVVDLDEPGVAAALSSSCTQLFRSRGSQGHPRGAMSWPGPVVAAPVCAGSCAVGAAVLGCYQLLPLPAVSHGGLVVASSTVGTALPIPTPSHGAAGHSGKHLLRAACV